MYKKIDIFGNSGFFTTFVVVMDIKKTILISLALLLSVFAPATMDSFSCVMTEESLFDSNASVVSQSDVFVYGQDSSSSESDEYEGINDDVHKGRSHETLTANIRQRQTLEFSFITRQSSRLYSPFINISNGNCRHRICNYRI